MVWVGKPEGREPLSRRGRTWQGSNKNGSLRNRMGEVDWIDVAQVRVVGFCEHGYEPSGFHKMQVIS